MVLHRVVPHEEDKVTVPQGDVLQQPPAPPGAEQAANVTSNAPLAAAGQVPSSTTGAQLPAGDGAAGGQVPRTRWNLSPVIEQQIAQAIQPVLDEFRQNLAQAVEQQTASLPLAGTRTGGENAPQTPPQGQPAQQPVQQQPAQQQPAPQEGASAVGQSQAGQAPQPVQTQQPQPSQSAPTSQAAQVPQAQQLPAQPQQAPAQPQQPAQQASPDGQTSAQPASQVQQGQQGLQGLLAPVTGAVQPALRPALQPVLQTVEQQSAQWLQAVLAAGVGGLLVESTRAAIQRRADQGLHALLQKLFETAPVGDNNPEIQIKTEQMLQRILRESLDALFAEGMRNTIQQGGQQAIQESLHGDFGGALKGVEGTLNAMAQALFTVFRREWHSVFRLALAFVLLTLEHSLAQSS